MNQNTFLIPYYFAGAIALVAIVVLFWAEWQVKRRGRQHHV